MSRQEGDGVGRERLEEQLRQSGIMFGVDQDGDLAVPFGNTITFIRPLEESGRKVVRVWAITNVDLELSDELTRFLATENAKLAFGGFEVDGSHKVAFSYTLLGEYLQRAELEAALAAVALAADRYNDEIKSRFGGKLFGEP